MAHPERVFDFQPTTRVVYGRHSLEQLGDLTKQLGGRRALIVTDPGIVKAGHVETALDSLDKAGIKSVVFQEVQENPSTLHVDAGVRFVRENGQIDFIIGLGGGSAMDCAKGINFLLTNGGKMEDYLGVGKAKQPMLPSIGVPTTAGTGSEAQSFALIAHAETHQKMACGDKKASFRTVILDPTLVQSVPKDVAAITGMDAISHAIESYVSTKRTPVSQMFSKEAWRLLAANYEIVLREPDNIEAWGEMQLGAHFAGMAIENSMLGAAHACANPLTARYGITHGIAVGLMLPHVIKFNSETVNGYYDELAKSVGLKGNFGSESLAARIIDLAEINQLPARLRDCYIDDTELPQLAREAAEQWTSKFNPRQVGENKMLQLYRMAF